MALVQKFKQLQWVVVGLETYTQVFACCENFAPKPSFLRFALLPQILLAVRRPTRDEEDIPCPATDLRALGIFYFRPVSERVPILVYPSAYTVIEV